jgi:hypothetical protein
MSPQDVSADEGDSTKGLPRVFIGILVTELAAILTLYFVGVYFGA